MAVVRKKQDDKNLKILRELVTAGGGGGNRQCFDCGQKGPTYVNMTIGSFVCTRCSGVLRGLTPPHRVKSISMATFTPEEIDYLKAHGNEDCAKTWLGLWDPKRIVHQDQRELIIDKYERKRYYLEPGSPLKSLPNATKLTNGNSNNANNNMASAHSNNVYSNNNNNPSNNSNLFHKNITLTPPSSVSSNGSHNGFNGFHRQNDDSFTTSAVNGLSSFINRPVVNKPSSMSISSVGNSETSSVNSNGFSTDSDFVADFNSANIFDATSSNGFGKMHQQNGGKANGIANGVNLVNGNGGGHAQLNGGGIKNGGGNENFADFDHAPIYNAADAYKFNVSTNNFFNTFNNSSSQFSSLQFPPNDIFGVFDQEDDHHQPQPTTQQHHPLFSKCNFSNLSYPLTNNTNNSSSDSLSTKNFYNNLNGAIVNNSNLNSNRNNGRIPNLEYQYEQSGYNNNNNGIQSKWNPWQEFQWPAASVPTPALSSANAPELMKSTSTTSNNIPNSNNNNFETNPNRWSLPMSNSSTSNSLSSSATFNSNSSLNSAPSVDRYAALKDLDEQLRESKAAAAHVASVVASSVVDSFNGGMAPSNANPFKAATLPQQQQQQPQPTHGQIANPFQQTAASTSIFNTVPPMFPTATATATHMQQNATTNGFASNQSFTNFNNGFGLGSAPSATVGVGVGVPNGCGFGFGSIQQQITTGGGNFNNPFAASSNNPFL